MPRKRKPAPLPPEPWQVVLNPVEIDIDVLVIVDPNHSAVAYVPLESAPWYPEDVSDPKRMLARFIAAAPGTARRCAALESELHAAQEQAKFALDFLNERDSARTLLRELAAAAAVYQDSVDSGLEARLEAGVGLSEVLRRAEAEAGEKENANG